MAEQAGGGVEMRVQIRRQVSGAIRKLAGAAPARVVRNHAPGRLRQPALGALRPLCEELADGPASSPGHASADRSRKMPQVERREARALNRKRARRIRNGASGGFASRSGALARPRVSRRSAPLAGVLTEAARPARHDKRAMAAV